MNSNELIKVSVIIPVYNVEKYLETCLNSIFNQTLNDFEIIAIDDKSTDNSLQILKKIQEKDNRLRIFENTENKGPSYCRNLGIANAKGEYIQFVDSDDCLKNNALEILYNEVHSKNLDFSMFLFKTYDDESKKVSTSPYSNLAILNSSFDDKIFNYSDLDGNTICKIAFSPVNKIYNLNFLKKVKAKFKEGIDVAEDLLFFYTIFLKADKISVIREYLYYYRVHAGSISTLDDKRSFDSIKVIQELIDLFKSSGIYDEYKKNLLYLVSVIYEYNYNRLKNEYKSEFLDSIKIEYLKWGDDLYDPYDDDNWDLNIKVFYLASFDSSNLKEFSLNKKFLKYEILYNKLNKKFLLLIEDYDFIHDDRSKLMDQNHKLANENENLINKNNELVNEINKLNDEKNNYLDLLNTIKKDKCWKLAESLNFTSVKLKK